MCPMLTVCRHSYNYIKTVFICWCLKILGNREIFRNYNWHISIVQGFFYFFAQNVSAQSQSDIISSFIRILNRTAAAAVWCDGTTVSRAEGEDEGKHSTARAMFSCGSNKKQTEEERQDAVQGHGNLLRQDDDDGAVKAQWYHQPVQCSAWDS